MALLGRPPEPSGRVAGIPGQALAGEVCESQGILGARVTSFGQGPFRLRAALGRCGSRPRRSAGIRGYRARDDEPEPERDEGEAN